MVFVTQRAILRPSLSEIQLKDVPSRAIMIVALICSFMVLAILSVSIVLLRGFHIVERASSSFFIGSGICCLVTYFLVSSRYNASKYNVVVRDYSLKFNYSANKSMFFVVLFFFIPAFTMGEIARLLSIALHVTK